MSITLPDPGPPNAEFAQTSDRTRMEKTAEALESRGFKTHIARECRARTPAGVRRDPRGRRGAQRAFRDAARAGHHRRDRRVGAVRVGASQAGGLDRETQGREMRKLGAAPDYIIGSAHAITDDGQIVVGSGSGSQLGAYAYAGGNVILVVGHQKLVSDLDEGLRRVREYSLPASSSGCRRSGTPAACWPRR